MSENPKVFISHASEDKERFVLDFAKKLYSKRIEAWVDAWEMLPGDSLVDKIWNEGIGQAQAMVVVISEYSVDKPWVKAELNTGVVRRIEGHSRLIPIIIGSVDDALIPESLRDTLWRRIRDLDDYDAEFESIVKSIYGQRDRPKLGETPAYARLAMDTIPGLGEVDSLILKLCCEELIRTADSVTAGIQPQPVLEQAQAKDIHEQDILDTLQILDSRGYIELGKVLGGGIINIKVSDYAFDEYARTFLPDYDEVYRSVALEIVNHGRHNGQDIVQSLNQPSVIVDHILRKMWNSGRIKAQEFPMRLIYIHEVTPELQRWLQET